MYISPNVTPEVKRRIAVEKKIVIRTVAELLKAGYQLSVFDGEEESRITWDAKELHKALMNTDEDFLNVWVEGEAKQFGWVKFVYGNYGNDVISDYTVNLESVLAPVNAYAETL